MLPRPRLETAFLAVAKVAKGRVLAYIAVEHAAVSCLAIPAPVQGLVIEVLTAPQTRLQRGGEREADDECEGKSEFPIGTR